MTEQELRDHAEEILTELTANMASDQTADRTIENVARREDRQRDAGV